MEPKDVKEPMALKTTIRPRVIIAYADPNGNEKPAKTMYAAGFVEGYSGSDILIDLPMGRHEFSRDDGTWRAGDCLNYRDARILEFEQVEASIKGGYGGSVEDWRKSLPMEMEAS